MTTVFTRRFSKDLDKIALSSVSSGIAEVIEDVEKAHSLSEIKNVKKLKGFSNAYRIRIGDYWIGVTFENNIVKFARIAHRKEIYKIFP